MDFSDAWTGHQCQAIPHSASLHAGYEGCLSGSAQKMARSRPACLARYSATSARASQAVAPSPGLKQAAPIETVTDTGEAAPMLSRRPAMPARSA